MGLFDTVTIEGLYCYHCGRPADGSWQTKDGDCTLSTFTFEEFASKHQDIYVFGFSGNCSECGEWLRITLPNTTDASQAYREAEADNFKRQWTEKSTALHPNHPLLWSTYYSLGFDNIWCSICELAGVEREGTPPDIDPAYLEDLWVKAKLDNAEGPKTQAEAQEGLRKLFAELQGLPDESDVSYD